MRLSRLSHAYRLASSALVFALPAAPAFAHGHHGHRASYRLHHAHLAATQQQNCGSFFGWQFPCAFGGATAFGAATSPQPQPQPHRQASVASPQYNRLGAVVSAPSAGVSASGGVSSGMANTRGVPQSLIDRVIKRESGGNPRAVSHGNYGLMQIRLSTARAMGYTGSAAGLLDPQTNMTYAVRYLAGAYRAAGGNEARAIALYSRGYYYEAKRQGFTPYQSGVTTVAAASTRAKLTYASYSPASAAADSDPKDH